MSKIDKLEKRIDELEQKIHNFEDSFILFRDALVKMQKEKIVLEEQNKQLEAEMSMLKKKIYNFLNAVEVQKLLQPIKEEIIDTRDLIRQLADELKEESSMKK